MKIIFPLIFVMLMFATQAESRPDWLPNWEQFINKTTQFKHFLKHKLTSFIGKSASEEHSSEEGTKRDHNASKNKFKEYVEPAEKSGKKIFVKIAPSAIQTHCFNDDPSIHMTTPQLISMHGYPAESHTIKTKDGYFLTLHRIPYSKRLPKALTPMRAVYLHHGLLGSSADWVIPDPEKALAFLLSDAGYDVWLANVRGNTYSRAHVTYDVDTYQFWNFTWHDVSQYDLPAAIDHISYVKGPKATIDYVGHSMGTTVLFALLSTKTEYNTKLRAGFALAPVAYMSDIKSPIHILAKYANNIQYLMKILGAYEFLPQNSVLRWLSKHACEINHYEEALCENSLFVVCGPDSKQFNKTLLPMILSHVPAGASTKSLIHYAQEIRNKGKFQQYDYGETGNMRQYGFPTPPEYSLNKITLPIALLSSKNDWLTSPADVNKLYEGLENPIENYVVPMPEFNHIDFLWAIDAPKLVYKKLLQLMSERIEIYDNEVDIKSV